MDIVPVSGSSGRIPAPLPEVFPYIRGQAGFGTLYAHAREDIGNQIERAAAPPEGRRAA